MPSVTSDSAKAKAAGRPPSPATQTLRAAMQQDSTAKAPRPREAYLKLLQEAGGPKSRNAAGIIVNREAKRFFGRSLGRGKRSAKGKGVKRGAGRQASPATALLRAQLQQDKAQGSLRDAKYYVRWLVDKVNMGLKGARPIVYRELRAVR